MVKIKTQAVEPDTCDPPGCRYLELWDADADPADREHRIAAFERVCPAHATDMPPESMLWWDGNWKPRRAYIEYQRAWFRRLNHLEWLERFPAGEEPMPGQIAGYTSDPQTTGSIDAPPQAEREGMVRAYGWTRDHNARKNLAVSAMKQEHGAIDHGMVRWSWTGHGDDRVLRIHSGGQLNQQQRGRVQAAADIQFGQGRCIVEG